MGLGVHFLGSLIVISVSRSNLLLRVLAILWLCLFIFLMSFWSKGLIYFYTNYLKYLLDDRSSL